jgi:hypothetical protein
LSDLLENSKNDATVAEGLSLAVSAIEAGQRDCEAGTEGFRDGRENSTRLSYRTDEWSLISYRYLDPDVELLSQQTLHIAERRIIRFVATALAPGGVSTQPVTVSSE